MAKPIYGIETEALSQTLRSLLEGRGMSGRELSRKLGSAHSTMSLVLVGQRQFTFIEFIRVCELLSVTESDFVSLFYENLEQLRRTI